MSTATTSEAVRHAKPKRRFSRGYTGLVCTLLSVCILVSLPVCFWARYNGAAARVSAMLGFVAMALIACQTITGTRFPRAEQPAGLPQLWTTHTVSGVIILVSIILHIVLKARPWHLTVLGLLRTAFLFVDGDFKTNAARVALYCVLLAMLAAFRRRIQHRYAIAQLPFCAWYLPHLTTWLAPLAVLVHASKSVFASSRDADVSYRGTLAVIAFSYFVPVWIYLTGASWRVHRTVAERRRNPWTVLSIEQAAPSVTYVELGAPPGVWASAPIAGQFAQVQLPSRLLKDTANLVANAGSRDRWSAPHPFTLCGPPLPLRLLSADGGDSITPPFSASTDNWGSPASPAASSLATPDGAQLLSVDARPVHATAVSFLRSVFHSQPHQRPGRVAVTSLLIRTNAPDRSSGFTTAVPRLRAGDRLRLTGPYGSFLPVAGPDAVFIAGGVGIAPFIAAIRDAVRRQLSSGTPPPTSPIAEGAEAPLLVWAVRSPHDVFFHSELNAAHAVLGLELALVVWRQESDEPNVVPPSIDSPLLPPAVAPSLRRRPAPPPPPKFAEVYNGLLDRSVLSELFGGGEHVHFCGPAPMAKAVLPILKELNVTVETEHFSM
jgi:predicted ferric reductase